MKCIPVTLKDGSVVMATVDDDVTELDSNDIEQLEAYVAYVKAKRKKKLQAIRGVAEKDFGNLRSDKEE